jgi:hypothetical protein
VRGEDPVDPFLLGVKRKGYHREGGSKGSVEQTCEPMDKTNRIQGASVGRAAITAKSISIKDAKRRFGGCARKAAELTPGDLLCVAAATEAVERRSDRRAEVSRRHSRPTTSAKLLRHSEAERWRNG